jgi:hypothetical protein
VIKSHDVGTIQYIEWLIIYRRCVIGEAGRASLTVIQARYGTVGYMQGAVIYATYITTGYMGEQNTHRSPCALGRSRSVPAVHTQAVLSCRDILVDTR